MDRVVASLPLVVWALLLGLGVGMLLAWALSGLGAY